MLSTKAEILFLVLVTWSKTSFGLTCLDCEKIQQPRHCRTVARCDTEEVCGTERLPSSPGLKYYRLGCFKKSSCLSSTQSNTSTICSQCCSNGDLCNAAACGEPDYPAIRGPICYSCPYHTYQQQCKDIEFCSPDEECSLLGEDEFGDVILRSRCSSRHPMITVIHHHANTAHAHLFNVYVFLPEWWDGPTFDRDIRDCKDVLQSGLSNTTGVYSVYVDVNGQLNKIKVYCDMDKDGGGWTVFQNRYDGSVDFYRNFSDYENGFGNVSGEFWLGLKWVFYMTKNRHQELRIDITYKDNTKEFEKYSNFSLGAPQQYVLHASGASGTAGDGFDGNHIEQSFTTADKDQDNYYDNCAVLKHGAYWYNQCNYSNLNGNYHNEDGGDWTKGFYWYLRNGLKASQMKFRKL